MLISGRSKLYLGRRFWVGSVAVGSGISVAVSVGSGISVGTSVCCGASIGTDVFVGAGKSVETDELEEVPPGALHALIRITEANKKMNVDNGLLIRLRIRIQKTPISWNDSQAINCVVKVVGMGCYLYK
jgi:hypothetical protein